MNDDSSMITMLQRRGESQSSMLSRRTRASLARVLRDYAESASVHGVGYIVSARSPADRVLWLCLVLLGLTSASFLSYEVFVSWQETPVVTHLKTTNHQVLDLEFPSVTICTEGINMEAVLAALNQDFSDWLERNGFSEESEEFSDEVREEALNTFLLETFNLDPAAEINLEEIVLAYSSPDPDQSLLINSMTDTMLSCQKSQDCDPGDYTFQGSCYQLHKRAVSWLEADYSCPPGYSLASVHNTQEKSFVANISSAAFWLGGLWSADTSTDTTDSWTASTTKASSTSTSSSRTLTLVWSDGQVDPAGCSAKPDSFLQQTLGSEHGLVANEVSQGAWSHQPVDTALPFLCKKGRSTSSI